MALFSIAIQEPLASVLSSMNVPGTKEDKSGLHITLVYIDEEFENSDAMANAIKCAYDVCKNTSMFEVSTKMITSFPGSEEGGKPVILRVDSPALVDFQKKLCKTFDANGVYYSKKFPDYHPHITLAYAPFETKFKDTQLSKRLSMNVSHVAMWVGDFGNNEMRIEMPLDMTIADKLTLTAKTLEVLEYAKRTATPNSLQRPLSRQDS